MKTNLHKTLTVLIFSLAMTFHQKVFAQNNDSTMVHIDTTTIVGDTIPEQIEPPQPKYYRDYGQSMNGIIIPDDEDSTILMLTLGNYSKDTSGNYSANGGAQPYNNNEPVVITTDRVYDDDSTRVIYTRGQQTYTTCCHDIFTEDAVILHRVDSGWRVSDSREGQFEPDFRTLTWLGTYGGLYYLIRRETSAVYAGGFAEDHQYYFIISRDSLKGPSIDLEVAHSDEMVGNCDTAHYGWNQSRDCGCYNNRGSTTYDYDSTLDCIVIRFTDNAVSYQCMRTNPKTTRTTQVWYMNEDTALLAIDLDSIAIGEDTTGHVKLIWKKGDRKTLKLSRKKIERALSKAGRRKKSGFIKSPNPERSIFDER